MISLGLLVASIVVYVIVIIVDIIFVDESVGKIVASVIRRINVVETVASVTSVSAIHDSPFYKGNI